MSNSDIAKLLAAASASYSAKCETNLENPVSYERFFEYYKNNIQNFLHLMDVDARDLYTVVFF